MSHEKARIDSGVRTHRKHSLPTVEYLSSRLSYCPETGIFTWINGPEHKHVSWDGKYKGKQAGSLKKHGYYEINIDGKIVFAHRAALAISHGDWPTGEVDHINGIRSDNRLENLREVSRSENQRNRAISARTRSGVHGVSKRNGRWVVNVGTGNGRHIGTFDTFEEAVEVRTLVAMDRGYHPNHGLNPRFTNPLPNPRRE